MIDYKQVTIAPLVGIVLLYPLAVAIARMAVYARCADIGRSQSREILCSARRLEMYVLLYGEFF